jgi:hypothetical protein
MQNPTFTDFFNKQIIYLHRAAPILSVSLKEKDYENIRNFADNWTNSETPGQELIFGIRTLLQIQKNQFSVDDLPCNFLYLLMQYVREMQQVENNPDKFQYKVRLTQDIPYTWYDASKDVRDLMEIIRAWSNNLLNLPEMNLPQTEKFLCDVFAGKIADPKKELFSNPKEYADMIKFDQMVQYGARLNNDAYFFNQRNGKTGTAAIMCGVWIPTGHLALLGTHPSVGLQLGERNKLNEYDFIWSFRFPSTTPGTYKVVRLDTSFNSNYYDGGYVGFDYTRYVIHKKRFELGLTSAIGYDYFSVANGFGTSPPTTSASILPIDVGSFNFSNGIRFKYFFSSRSFIGIYAKYNLINYCNSGGTDLSGQAFTIELVYGSH